MQRLFSYPYYLILFLVVVSCGSHKKTSEINPSSLVLSNDSTQFYDVQSFLKGEIKDVASTPYFIYSITTVDGKRKDSVPITSATFEILAQVFLINNISDTSIKKFYKEDVFRDLSTNSVTISYSTLNRKLPVQSLDVLLDQETNKVNYILIRTNNEYEDSTVITQLNWKRGKSYLINKTVIKNKGEHSSTQQFVCWNQ